MISQERGFRRSTNLPPQRCSPTWTSVCLPQESWLGSRWICLTHHLPQAYNTFENVGLTFLTPCVCRRCPMLPPVPCVALLSCSVSCTHLDRSPSAWTPTVAWALPSGVSAGERRDTRTVIRNLTLTFSWEDSKIMVHVMWMCVFAVCTQAISLFWFLLWSWRPMRLCGCLRSVSIKYEWRSVRILWWRCAPKAWAPRPKPCGSVLHLHTGAVTSVWRNFVDEVLSFLREGESAHVQIGQAISSCWPTESCLTSLYIASQWTMGLFWPAKFRQNIADLVWPHL